MPTPPASPLPSPHRPASPSLDRGLAVFDELLRRLRQEYTTMAEAAEGRGRGRADGGWDAPRRSMQPLGFAGGTDSARFPSTLQDRRLRESHVGRPRESTSLSVSRRPRESSPGARPRDSAFLSSADTGVVKMPSNGGPGRGMNRRRLQSDSPDGHATRLSMWDFREHATHQSEASDRWRDISDVSCLWPSNLEFRLPGATAPMKKVGTSGAMPKTHQSMRLSHWLSLDAASAGLTQKTPLWEDGCFHPDSSPIVAAEFLGLIMVLNDIVVSPVVLAWDVPIKGPLLTLAYITFFYWLADFALRFNIGVYHESQLCMRRAIIAKQYLRGWLLPDFFMLVVDLTSLLVGADGHPMLLRTAKAIRCCKGLRIMRLFRFVDKALTYCLSFKSRFAIQITFIVFLVLVLNHIVCCVWWTIGGMASDTNRRWRQIIREDAEEAGMLYEYMSSLHWTVAQMTLGATDIVAGNSAERGTSVCLLYIAVFTNSSLVSFISAEIVQLIMMKQDKMKALSKLRRYLRQERVPSRLAVEVVRQVTQRVSQPKQVGEIDVGALSLLSRSLKQRLLCAVRIPLIAGHPIFHAWGQTDMGAVKDVCMNAVRVTIHNAQDDLFMPGDSATRAIKIIDGSAAYTQTPGFSLVPELTTKSVGVGRWVCEACLWVNWTHVGNLVTETLCKLLTIDVAVFFEVLLRQPEVYEVTYNYAKNFHRRVVTATPPFSEWPSDIHVPFADPAELLAPDFELHLLESAVQSGSLALTESQVARLRQEMEGGKCYLVQGENKELCRMVSVVAMKIVNEYGHVFAQLGTVKAEGGRSYSCELPGSKRARGEIPMDLIQRWLDSELSVFKDRLEFEGWEHDQELKTSATYGGVVSKYLREVQVCTFHGTGEDLQADVAFPTQVFDERDLEPYQDYLDPAELGSRKVYALPHNQDVKLCAWLTPPELAFLLTSEESAAALEAWLKGFDIVVNKVT